MDIQTLLENVKNGTLSLEAAENELKKLPYEDLGFAKLDHHRKLRQGFGEVIFCSGKTDAHLVSIYQTLCSRGVNVLGTRASRHQYELVRQAVPGVQYDPVSRLLKYELHPEPQTGCIAVCTAGTADIPVAEEAAQTAEFFGSHVERYYDVGVAGIHRLLSKIDAINQASCIIAIAGMEGALASVIAGLADKPVIAVPTSVGYGANLGGISALLTMINSCANGICVVNIDNGYGAAYTATQINRLVNQPSPSAVSAPAPAPAEPAKAPVSALVETPVGSSVTSSSDSQLWMLETNIDDCSGEAMGYVMEKLFAAGARDVFYSPIFMKKNRPAYLLRVMCMENQIAEMEALIFTHTTTIGVRRFPAERTALPRRIEEIETPYGPAQVKICLHGETEYAYPEYESVRRICEATDLSYQTIYQEVAQAWKQN
jgi:NCAIR mutase (PurE)-related protein